MNMGKRLSSADYRVQSDHMQCRQSILAVLQELEDCRDDK